MKYFKFFSRIELYSINEPNKPALTKKLNLELKETNNIVNEIKIFIIFSLLFKFF